MKIEINGDKVGVEFSEEDREKHFTPHERATLDLTIDRMQSIIDKIDPNSGVLFFVIASTREPNHLVLDDQRKRLAPARAAVQARLQAGEKVAGVPRSNVAGWLDVRVRDVINFEKAGLLTRLKGIPVMYAADEVLAFRGCFAEIDPAFLEAVARGEKNLRGKATIHPLSAIN